MNEQPDAPPMTAGVESLSSAALAGVLNQSVDCVKLIGIDGHVHYMNPNGLCAMEIDDFDAVRGRQWADLWPNEARETILSSFDRAREGEAVRFRAFCPTAKGTQRWWDVTVSAVTTPQGEPAGFLSISRDVTENELGREAMTIAAAELRHRLKNTYAMIASLLNGFARGDPGNEAFASDMGERLRALSTAQSLFATNDAPCDIEELIPALLTPFGGGGCAVTVAELPPMRVDQGQADAIALVVGELAVNSSKHGAMMHGGTVAVRAANEAGVLTILWSEVSNGAVQSHSRDGGQGLRLMQRIVRARRGTIDYRWNARGLDVELAFRVGAE